MVHVTANIGITGEASTGVAPIAVDDSGKVYARFYLIFRIERVSILQHFVHVSSVGQFDVLVRIFSSRIIDYPSTTSQIHVVFR